MGNQTTAAAAPVTWFPTPTVSGEGVTQGPACQCMHSIYQHWHIYQHWQVNAFCRHTPRMHHPEQRIRLPPRCVRSCTLKNLLRQWSPKLQIIKEEEEAEENYMMTTHTAVLKVTCSSIRRRTLVTSHWPRTSQYAPMGLPVVEEPTQKKHCWL